jgi:peptidyl-prolyl cis-trans isomerase B (cyclophilin B)
MAMRARTLQTLAGTLLLAALCASAAGVEEKTGGREADLTRLVEKLAQLPGAGSPSAIRETSVPSPQLLALCPTRDDALWARPVLEKLKESKDEKIAGTAKALLAHPVLSTDLPRARLILPDGAVELVLLEDAAPNTVANFVVLAEKKFYDHLIFHGVIESFMAQSGDPTGTGEGGPGYWIADEANADALGLDKLKVKDAAAAWGGKCPKDAAELTVKELYEKQGYHFTPSLPSWPVRRGVVAMANVKGRPNTNASQFFITQVDCPWLDGKNTVFGLVTHGQELVDRMKPQERLVRVEITWKRDHPYTVKKLGEK